uniref:Uncharacterized protein n=1 Tax=Tetradesmus obliquus TaxID=3088 RepID=A0A383W1F6_TETOB|eukprot:jgi/Sobl393_1/4690/SZX71515.1
MQLAEPTTPAPAAAAANAAKADAAAPPTPLEQRQWQRLAQRAVRLAVTAFKDGCTRCADASARGTAEATQLTNSLLSQRYMPDLKLPEALQQVAGLQVAAAAKLHRQQLQHLQQLGELLDEMQAAVQDMQAALEGVTSQLSEGAPWQHSLPIFHCLALPEGAALLQQLLQMHSQELAVQQGMLQSFSGLVQEAGSCLQERSTAAQPNSRALSGSSSSTSKAGSIGAGRRAGVRSVEDCRRLLTAGITTWMVRPCIDEGCSEQLLQLLTDEMAGF